MTPPASLSAPSLTALTFHGQSARWRHATMQSHETGRLLYITKGQGQITIAGLNQSYGPNNLIYLPPDTMYGIELGPTAFGQLLALPAEENSLGTEPFQLRLPDVAAQKELQGMMDAIERESMQGGDTRAVMCHVGLLTVFIERQREKQNAQLSAKRRRTAAARLVARYTALIAKDFRNDRSMADYAAALGVTPTHLTRSCKLTCNRSALALRNERIYYEACVMLRESTAPIQDIAKQLGFASAAYFTRSFQEKSGVTPSAFRRSQ